MNAQNAIGLPKCLEWLWSHSGLAVNAFLPDSLSEDPDLGGLLFRGETLAGASHGLPDRPPASPEEGLPPGLPFPPYGLSPFGAMADFEMAAIEAAGAGDRSGASPLASALRNGGQAPGDRESPEGRASLVGAPHPLSPGETRLARFLARDGDLAPLFFFNQRIATRSERIYVVDLYSPKLRLAVEVDGYSYHSDPKTFQSDRDRDYHLMISGYRVLRLTHNEVMRDAALALEKIRDAVNFLATEQLY
jgi:very-short-patch-repair endonuclease